MAVLARKWTSKRHDIGSLEYKLQQPAVVPSKGILECNALAMNSAIALMTPHNIVASKSILE
jgi:hypothetical protein